MIAPSMPKLSDKKAGEKLFAGLGGESTIIADFDFETYSPAGYVWTSPARKWKAPQGTASKGLAAVGVAKYTEHPEAEVLSLAYNLKQGEGVKVWTPNMAPPLDLFQHVTEKKLLEAWNVAFEYYVWVNICVPKYRFPPLPSSILRCAMAKARAFALPGSLKKAGEVLNIEKAKDVQGTRLLAKFSVPRNPTKTDARTRLPLALGDPDSEAFKQYNARDIEAEAECSAKIPDLSPTELEFWQYDQEINRRGVQLDIDAVHNCINILEQAQRKYTHTLQKITQNEVQSASEIQKLLKWLKKQGVFLDSLTAEVVQEALRRPNLPAPARQVLEIRVALGSAAVKKLYSMMHQVARDGRLHDLFVYHSARTGRAAGAGPQPQNLPNSGLKLLGCKCNKAYPDTLKVCPYCGDAETKDTRRWDTVAVDHALGVISARSLECVEYYFKDALATISGCLRGLFIAAPGHDLICSDYSAIEAVVLAALAGEEWRNEVFRTHGKIYEMSASKISGVLFEEFEKYYVENKQHHPLRKKIGKVAELASGYQGWIGAWKQFGADEFFSDEEIKQAVLAWRKASPAIVEMWGGQERNWQTEYYGIEGAAAQAILYPGNLFEYRGISYIVKHDILYCRLLSGRLLTYHKPRLETRDQEYYSNKRGYAITFSGWNTNPKNGAIGWTRIHTYGGRLVENIVQATARDILTHAIVNLEKAGYKVVLHIHDEVVVEVPEGIGSIEQFERIMSAPPAWAAGWAVKASGGWRGKRYRKD